MRLLRLDSATGNWIIEDLRHQPVPFYAVLSHTWGRDEDEVTFDDIVNGTHKFNDTSKPGYSKLRFCHDQAERDGLRYFWIDTCCIKKSDSQELQYSLNSMFYWYTQASRCYVHLSDVSIDDFAQEERLPWTKAFAKSRWFKRGWTLQELIAPKSVVFYSKEETVLGDKRSLEETLNQVTGIPFAALGGLELSRFTKAERLSWAKGRETKIPEDSAYCLIGIFGVKLVMSYADGEHESRRSEALEELDLKIELSLQRSERQADVIRIGGASWTDLNALNQRQLRRLDTKLDEFKLWLLQHGPTQVSKLTQLSRDAGDKMKALLAEFQVSYDDMSDLEASVKGWHEPWRRFRNRDLPEPARLQGFLENRWHWTREHELVLMSITAVKTLIDLMIWRGRWKIQVA